MKEKEKGNERGKERKRDGREKREGKVHFLK